MVLIRAKGESVGKVFVNILFARFFLIPSLLEE